MSSRAPDYQFVSTDPDELEAELVSSFEQFTGITPRPGSAERLIVSWMTYVLLQVRAAINYAANQNIPSRAEGENLDALGESIYGLARPEATSATCTVRFTISEAQETPVLVPTGTRVTDANRTLVWQTISDAYIPIGDTTIDLRVYCQTPGKAGNDYLPGQINTIVDVFDYYVSCSNITKSANGSDAATDSEYYDILRQSTDKNSTAGAMGSYIYHAKKVSNEIGDVVANSPSGGEVYLYVLMADGTIASSEVKRAVLEACSGNEVRPFTDHVQTADPLEVTYNIDLTYYIPSNSAVSSVELQAAVQAAVQEYVAWQSGRLGRDINPYELYKHIVSTGIKRLELREPAFTTLRSGVLGLGKTYQYSETVPQVAKLGTLTITSGGYEDE